MTTSHDYRRNWITGLTLGSLIALLALLGTGCKKQLAETEKKSIPKYWKVVDIDLDGQTTSTPIFWNKTNTDAVNDDESTAGWENWDYLKRQKWCDNHNPDQQNHYCDICSMSPLCRPTPVKFKSYSFSNGIISWETATEANVDYFSIQGSFDGKVFTEEGRIKPHGAGKYTFTLK